MKVIRVCCAIIEKEKNILVAQRGDGVSQPLMWEFPGGKMEDGESPEECIVREIKEELDIEIGVKVNLNSSIYDYGNKVIELIPLICYIEGGEIKCKEHKSIAWGKPLQFENIEWAPADISVYDEYLRHLKEM